MHGSSLIGTYLRIFLATAAVVGPLGCGSDSVNMSDFDASLGPGDAGVADANTAVDLPEGQEAGVLQETGTPMVGYCTSKPAIATVTSISGTWVIRALATQQVSAIGTILYPQTLFYMLTTMNQSGSTVVANGVYCDRAEIDQPSSRVTVVMPDKWAHTQKVVNRSGTLAMGAGGISVLNFGPLVELAGAVPGPDTDALPTTVTDPRVIDEDQDGNPGITINITGLVTGSLYSVQRQVTSIAAIPVAPDRFEGVLSFISDQKVLDSNPVLLTTLYATALATTDPTPCASTFAMVKVAEAEAAVDAGPAVSCEWVRQHETALFPE